MDDLISRQAAIDALGERPMVWTDDDHYALGERNQYDMDKLAIETLPSAQPEIIRCKDCRFFHPRSVYGHGLCDVHCNGIGESEVVRGTYFCADAERKEE